MATPGHDVVIVGGGHNALVAAILLRRAGFSVLVLERRDSFGGAAVSARPFPGLEARISRYAYLVSLFPASLAASLGAAFELRRRRVDSCTPDGVAALVLGGSELAAASFKAAGLAGEVAGWARWQSLCGQLAAAVAPSLTEPLLPASEIRRRVGAEAWSTLVERPVGEVLGELFTSDLVRGLVLTDALIGTFAHSREASLRQNRCLLYHLVGNGHGHWDVPVGGMGAVSAELERVARAAGVELRSGVAAERIEADGVRAEVRTEAGANEPCRVVLCGAAPAVLERLLDRPPSGEAPEGAQVKLNLLLDRLPRLRSGVDPAVAFAGTLHVNERLSQLDSAYATASDGVFPSPVPCEVYCHTLTDPTILGEDLRRRGAQALTAFALQTPARLFRSGGIDRRAAGEAVLESLQSVLDEPLEDRILRDSSGSPCVEVHTPADLEADLALPGGHIFHRDLRWPWAEDGHEAGRWGVETDLANVVLCGAGARRGGAVSGIPGHNAARAAAAVLGGSGALRS